MTRRRPGKGRGDDGLYPTFDSISRPAGPLGYRADFSHGRQLYAGIAYHP